MELIQKGCQQLVHHCGNIQPHEKVLVISDESTRDIGDAIREVVCTVTEQVIHQTIPAFTIHGQEPPREVSQEMLKSDVIFGLTTMSMAHTQARYLATQKGARYLSLPDYSMDLIKSESLQTDFRALSGLSNRLADMLTQGQTLTLTSDLGTQLTCSISSRKANAAPGWCDGKGSLASPPDSETNIALIEQESEGLLVVDGSIPCQELGLLSSSLTLHVQGGRVRKIEGDRSKDILEELLGKNDSANPKRVLAELGIGLNPNAKLCGVMLVDEGSRGTVHIGLGSNVTIGGCNQTNFHLDLVINRPSLEVDGKTILIKGELR